MIEGYESEQWLVRVEPVCDSGKRTTLVLVDCHARDREGGADGSVYGSGVSSLDPSVKETRRKFSIHETISGVSFRSTHDSVRGITYTVISNTSTGAWPLARLLDDRLLH
jgi:hypothetical protein